MHQSNKKLFTAAYIILMAVNLVTSMGYSMTATLISMYAVSFGATLGVAGILGGIYSLAALIVRPIGGLASDRFNKRKLCLIFSLLTSLSLAGYALAWNIHILFLFRILHGIAFGVSSTASIALVSEFIPKERMGEGLGYYGLGQVLSQVCGPIIGIYVRDRLGYNAMFLMISLLTLIIMGFLSVMRYEPNEKLQVERNGPSFRLSHLIAIECLAYTLIGGMFSLGNGIVNAFLLLIGEERGIPGIALFFSVNAVVLFGVRIFIGRIADEKSLTIVTNISLILTALSMLLIGGARSLPIILVAAVIKAVGQGGGQLSLQLACIKKVDPTRVGIAVSTFYIGADIGQSIGPMLGGQMSDWLGYSWMLVVIAAIVALSMVFFNIYQWRQTRKADALAAP